MSHKVFCCIPLLLVGSSRPQKFGNNTMSSFCFQFWRRCESDKKKSKQPSIYLMIHCIQVFKDESNDPLSIHVLDETIVTRHLRVHPTSDKNNFKIRETLLGVECKEGQISFCFLTKIFFDKSSSWRTFFFTLFKLFYSLFSCLVNWVFFSQNPQSLHQTFSMPIYILTDDIKEEKEKEKRTPRKVK